MHEIFENILIMILTIVILVTGAYLVLLLLGWGLKLKSGTREEQGLTDLWIANQTEALRNKPENEPKKNRNTIPPTGRHKPTVIASPLDNACSPHV